MLMNSAPTDPVYRSYVDTFQKTLQTLGWRDSQNLRLDTRWIAGDPERIRPFAEELVATAPDVILASGTADLKAVLRATRTIPIVFVQVSDPVAQGFVSDLAHPGGNMTGFGAYEFAMGAKWVDLLKQTTPGLARIAVMFDPDTAPQSALFLRSIEAAAPGFGLQVKATPVHDTDDIERNIVEFAREPNGGLLLPTDSFTIVHQELIVALTARYRLPTMAGSSDYASKGGLMSYAIDYPQQFRQAAIYADRILKGTKPGDLPIQLPTKFNLVINLKTARALGVDVPTSLLMNADEVIE